MKTLTGKNALVTGAAKRLGRAIAETLAAQSTNVVVHYGNSASEAEALVERLRGQGVKAWALQADLADTGEAAALITRATELAGPLDMLVNNAAIFPDSRLANVTSEDILANVRVNALSPFVMGRAFAEQGRGGAIVNMLDCRIVDYDDQHVAYHLSKRMLSSLTRMMAVEFAPAVRVNAVAPGLILPPPGKDESYLKSLESTNPLECHGDPEDVAAAVRFLLESAFVTGQIIYVDGGRHMKGRMYE
jgi:pteridine reductase